ncbi:DNA-methyltransferase [Brachyspira hampsonii]|uniref:Methyltransferase n=1 Tax=Brachyspira hampsonii 30446 TaxID=1289135 RepID=A0A2U4EVQ1_9SPIR|nr:DNA methyltransferase [Brachyspira hampsonii]EKV56946.1 DNA methylase N-4/N-6 domain-containing protein [Brachyspira hampsonii 30446]MBW5389927.1 site-specific DNA-methyltransferase [Brachyspira hampsonii]MBW5393571.1 site-specific DNA-methyltransferase [Brachyspira hampsonii]OEJ15605.1 DNA methylase N-4 [Brachyspira hampsonii]
MNTKVKSVKNKTIDFDINTEEGKFYFNKCIIDNENIKEYNKKDIINKTINGNTFDVLKKIENNIADLMIVDPPYNISKNYHGFKFKDIDNLSYEKYTHLWVESIIPMLKENATIYVCCDWKSSLVIGNVLDKYFNIQNRITWQREKGRGAKNNWKNGMEDIWFATISNKYTFNVDDVKIRRKVIAPYRIEGKPKDWIETKDGNFRDTYPSNFWDDISIPYWSMPENTAHPTQKPEKLIAKLILASSNENDFIFDPFLGSGTTSVVAKKLGRNYSGIEQHKTYCAWAEKRIELAEQNKEIQGYTDNIFWERNTISIQKNIKTINQ